MEETEASFANIIINSWASSLHKSLWQNMNPTREVPVLIFFNIMKNIGNANYRVYITTVTSLRCSLWALCQICQLLSLSYYMRASFLSSYFVCFNYLSDSCTDMPRYAGIFNSFWLFPLNNGSQNDSSKLFCIQRHKLFSHKILKIYVVVDFTKRKAGMRITHLQHILHSVAWNYRTNEKERKRA